MPASRAAKAAADRALERLPFFWRQAFKRSTLVDIETTGLEPTQGHMPVAGAKMRFGASRPEETWFTFETAQRVPEGIAKRKYTPVAEEGIEQIMEPFSRAKWEASWAEARAKWMEEHPNVPFPARKWFSQLLARGAKSGDFIWTHNVQFDITRWGSQYAHPAAIKLWRDAEVGQYWTEFEPETARLYPSTTEEMYGITRRVWREPRFAVGAQRHWYGQYRRLVEEAVQTGKPMLADSLAITRAMFGMAQERGMMPATGDIFTGASLDALMYAYRIPEKGVEFAHGAAYDIEARLQRVLPHVVETAERLYAGERLSARQARALQMIGEMQPEMAAQYVEKSFAQAKLSLDKYGSFPLRGEARGTDLNELLTLYEERWANRSYRMQYNLREIMSHVEAMTAEEIEAIAVAERRLPKLATEFKLGNIVKAGGRRIRQALAGRNPWLMAGAAAVGLFVAGKVLGPKREDHNVVRGFQEDGLSRHNRELLTDFGSGFRMDREQIHPDILQFRAETWKHKDERLRIKAQIAKLGAALQARMGRFEETDFTYGDSTMIEGLNRARQDTRFVNLSKFHLQVEDADTIILQRKGVLNWLKAQFGFGQTVVRLAGIDAPETSGHQNDIFNKLGLRWRWEQPHAAESTEMLRTMLRKSKNIALLTTQQPETYGRYLGVLAEGGGKNINLELIRQGGARNLAFGQRELALLRRDAAESAEVEAIEESRGMWQHARYLRQKAMEETMGRQVTFNLLTRMDVLAASAPMATMASELTALEGDKFFAHQPYGMGHTMRRLITDFGSFHRGLIAMARRFAGATGDVAGQYWKQSQIKTHINYLRGELATQAKMAAGEKGVFMALEMAPEEIAEMKAALAKFEAVASRPEGARIFFEEAVEGMDRAKRIGFWKMAARHEGFHEAVANVEEMRLLMNDVKISRHTLEEFKRQHYGLSDETIVKLGDKTLEMTSTELAELERFHREEIVNFMVHPDATAGIEWLETTIGFEMMETGELNSQALRKLRQLDKDYHRRQRAIDAQRLRSAKQKMGQSMTRRTQARNSPMGAPPRVRLNDNPGVVSGGGVGEVQRMYKDRKHSKRMYQP